MLHIKPKVGLTKLQTVLEGDWEPKRQQDNTL
jgi:hypothetical protein